MTHGFRYWIEDPDAPFAILLDLLETYLEPEAYDYEGLQELARDPASHNAEDTMRKFKEQLWEALADPSHFPGDGVLSRVAHYDDGSPERFLRRLWRDLYPDEPVPGGDEEFREQLRQLIHGEVYAIPNTLTYYIERWNRPKSQEERSARAREIWEKFYPGEPVP